MKKIDLNRDLFLSLGFAPEVDDEGFESLVKTYDNGATAEYYGSGFTAWMNGKNIEMPEDHYAYNIPFASEADIRFLDNFINNL